MSSLDLIKLNKKELITICKERGVKGYSNKSKEKLIQLIKTPNLSPLNTNTQKKSNDNYTMDVLKKQYDIHMNYVLARKQSAKTLNITFRLPSIPEDISENMIKFIIHKLGDKTSKWDCSGDLYSTNEGKQECKCFTSVGPISFTPSSDWNVIYFLDAKEWLNDNFKLYKCILKRTSDVWKNIKVNKKDTFQKQCDDGRRPRIGWDSLFPQIKEHCNKVFEGTFQDIINQEVVSDVLQ
jgi:hypothetical protein